MARLLILGGERHIPFARSRLAAMKARGATTATERYQLSDAVVTVRLVNGEEFILITGGYQSLEMDSGVIDLSSGFRGYRRDTDSTLALLDGYALGATGGGFESWRSKPGTVPNGQTISRITFSPLAGHIRDDLTRAPSFEPIQDRDTQEFETEDSALVAKIAMATNQLSLTPGCPPSVFTGRTRLYVQAMYGRPLHVGDSTTVGPSLVPGSPPSLSVPAYQAVPGVSYPAVSITTNTGVYYHAATGQHWLLNVSASHVTAYPLRATAAGEALRRYALATEALDDADRERIEAYVLAHSLPDVSQAVSLALGASVGLSSMGYGWHWNKSGTAADAVFLTTFDQSAHKQAMISTHRRISVAWADGTPTSASVSTVEVASWAVYRRNWCVAAPLWALAVSEKVTPADSDLFTCDAPIYVFYKGDDLQSCRVSVTEVPATEDTRTYSINFATGSHGDAVNMYTAGLLEGFCEDADAATSYFQAVFTCGEASTGALALGKVRTAGRWEVTDKVLVSPASPSSYGLISGDWYNVLYGYDVPYSPLGGYYDYTGTFHTTGYSTVLAYNPALLYSCTPPIVGFTSKVYQQEIGETSQATIIIPFYDAEAVLMDGQTIITTTKTGQIIKTHESNAFGTGQAFISPWLFPGGSLSGPYHAWLVSGVGAYLTSNSPPTSVDVDTTVSQLLVSKAGALTASLGSLAEYHIEPEETAGAIGVISSASTVDTVVIADTAIEQHGVESPVSPPMVIVGWV